MAPATKVVQASFDSSSGDDAASSLLSTISTSITKDVYHAFATASAKHLSEIARLKQAVAELERQNEASTEQREREREIWLRDRQEMNSERGQWDDERARQTTQTAWFKEECGRLQSDVREMKGSLRESQSQVKELQGELRDSRSEADVARDERDRAVKLLHKAQLETAEWKKEFGRVETEATHLQHNLAELDQSKDHYRNQYRDYKDQTRDWQAQYLKAEEDKRALTSKVDDLRDRERLFEQEKQALTAKIEELEREKQLALKLKQETTPITPILIPPLTPALSARHANDSPNSPNDSLNSPPSPINFVDSNTRAGPSFTHLVNTASRGIIGNRVNRVDLSQPFIKAGSKKSNSRRPIHHHSAISNDEGTSFDLQRRVKHSVDSSSRRHSNANANAAASSSGSSSRNGASRTIVHDVCDADDEVEEESLMLTYPPAEDQDEQQQYSTHLRTQTPADTRSSHFRPSSTSYHPSNAMKTLKTPKSQTYHEVHASTSTSLNAKLPKTPGNSTSGATQSQPQASSRSVTRTRLLRRVEEHKFVLKREEGDDAPLLGDQEREAGPSSHAHAQFGHSKETAWDLFDDEEADGDGGQADDEAYHSGNSMFEDDDESHAEDEDENESDEYVERERQHERDHVDRQRKEKDKFKERKLERQDAEEEDDELMITADVDPNTEPKTPASASRKYKTGEASASASASHSQRKRPHGALIGAGVLSSGASGSVAKKRRKR